MYAWVPMCVHLCACKCAAVVVCCCVCLYVPLEMMFSLICLLKAKWELVLIIRSQRILKPFSNKLLLWFLLITCILNIWNKLYTISNCISTESLLFQEMKQFSPFHHFLFHENTHINVRYFWPSEVLHTYREWKGNTVNQSI